MPRSSSAADTTARRPGSRSFVGAVLSLAALGGAVGTAGWFAIAPRGALPPATANAESLTSPAGGTGPMVAPRLDGRMLDPRPAAGAGTRTAWSAPPLPTTFARPAPAPDRIRTARLPAPSDSPRPAPATTAVAAPMTAAAVVPPLPVPRPAELRAPPAAERVAERPAPRRRKTAGRGPAAPEDNRTFLEKLLGIGEPSAPPASYAALGAGPVPSAPAPRLTPVPDPASGAGVAVYDISAQVVVMPNGERLEAHSGLGEKRDDPRFVHLRMRGATPPGTYELTERESLFHGVRAVRLNPVGGSAAIHGRAGILAHTYLLGPDGSSNGCISFRDYDRFLQAFLRGEVRRIVVVAGSFSAPADARTAFRTEAAGSRGL